MTFASPSPFGPSAMLLSFKTFETETFGTGVRLLFPRADHLLCPASSLFRVNVRPLKLLFARQPRSYSRRHRSRVVSFRLRLQSFIFASAKFSAYPLVIRRGNAKRQAPRSLPLALLGAFLAFSSSVWRRFP